MQETQRSERRREILLMMLQVIGSAVSGQISFRSSLSDFTTLYYLRYYLLCSLWIMTRDDNALYLPLSFFWRNSNNPVSPGGKPSNVYLTRKMISCNQSSRILSHHLGHFYLRKYPRYHTGWKIGLLMKSWKIIKLNFLFPKIKYNSTKKLSLTAVCKPKVSKQLFGIFSFAANFWTKLCTEICLFFVRLHIHQFSVRGHFLVLFFRLCFCTPPLHIDTNSNFLFQNIFFWKKYP